MSNSKQTVEGINPTPCHEHQVLSQMVALHQELAAAKAQVERMRKVIECWCFDYGESDKGICNECGLEADKHPDCFISKALQSDGKRRGK